MMQQVPTPTAQHSHPEYDVSRLIFGTTGLIAVVFGALILIWPSKSAVAVMVVVAAMMGVWVLINGVIYVALALFSRDRSAWSRIGYTLLGLLFVIGAITIFSNILFSAATITIMLAATVGVLWIMEAVLAFATVKRSSHRVLSVVYGTLGLIAGATMLLSPLYSVALLWLFMGVSLVVLGVAQVARAFTAKPSSAA